MKSPQITVCFWDYDRTRALLDGRVPVRGFEPEFVVLDPEKAFLRTFPNPEFDVVEMSLSYHLTAINGGTAQYVALPIFLSRAFRHSAIYVRTDRGITGPADLSGKIIGSQDYDMTAAVVIRALLREDYGVRPETLRWRIGEETSVRAVPRRVRHVDDVEIEAVVDQSLDEMLGDGGLDALICLRAPPSYLRGATNVARLFPDYRRVEQDYFRRNAIFPIMHVLGVRSALVDKYPALPGALFEAFLAAKALAVAELDVSFWVPKTTLPWLAAELEDTRQILGGDFWPYGISGNEKTLRESIRWHREDGLANREISIAELFPTGAGVR